MQSPFQESLVQSALVFTAEGIVWVATEAVRPSWAEWVADFTGSGVVVPGAITLWVSTKINGISG